MLAKNRSVASSLELVMRTHPPCFLAVVYVTCPYIAATNRHMHIIASYPFRPHTTPQMVIGYRYSQRVPTWTAHAKGDALLDKSGSVASPLGPSPGYRWLGAPLS